MKRFDFCAKKNEQEGSTFYPHFKCGQDSIGETGVRINFAVSNGGQLNSSFLTRNEDLVKEYKMELKKYGFKEIPDPNPENPRQNAKWYASKEYNGLQVLWEFRLDTDKRKVWHIGFVWNKSQIPQ